MAPPFQVRISFRVIICDRIQLKSYILTIAHYHQAVHICKIQETTFKTSPLLVCNKVLPLVVESENKLFSRDAESILPELNKSLHVHVHVPMGVETKK